MKLNWPTFPRGLVKLSRFTLLSALIYGLFVSLLIVHDFNDDADRAIFRRAIELDKAVYQLRQTKDSLYQAGRIGVPAADLVAELQ